MKTSLAPRVLIALYYYAPYVSWLTSYAVQLAVWLIKKWYTVDVFCLRHDVSLPVFEILDGVSIYRYPVRASFGKGMLSPSFAIDVVCKSYKYDHIICHYPNADLWFSAFFIPSYKLIVVYHCDVYLWKWIISSIIQRISYGLMFLWLWRARLIIGNTIDYFQNSFFHKFEYKYKAIYPPIDTTKFNTMLSDQTLYNRIRLENGVQIHIGFIGRMVYEKGLPYLLKSLEYLPSAVKLYIVWDYKKVMWWSIYNELKSSIQHVGNRVELLWHVSSNQLAGWYKAMDVVVLPSIDPLESFGMVQVESMICGTPVITTNLPWIREVVNKTWYGLLVPPCNSNAIADAILHVVSNKDSLYCHDLDIFDYAYAMISYDSVLKWYTSNSTDWKWYNISYALDFDDTMIISVSVVYSSIRWLDSLRYFWSNNWYKYRYNVILKSVSLHPSFVSWCQKNKPWNIIIVSRNKVWVIEDIVSHFSQQLKELDCTVVWVVGDVRSSQDKLDIISTDTILVTDPFESIKKHSDRIVRLYSLTYLQYMYLVMHKYFILLDRILKSWLTIWRYK